MSLHKNRPTDAIERLSTSFKHFENKIDKLQDDLNYHGQTLSDLRVMVLNLSSGTITAPDTKVGDANKRPQKRTMAIQYDTKYSKSIEHKLERRNSQVHEGGKLKRKSVTEPVPVKLKTKSLHSPKILSSLGSPFHTQISKLEANQIHMQRHRKAEAGRKLTDRRALEKRQKKSTEIKISKITKA